MDFKILYAINNLHTGILDKLMVGITYLGEKGIFWILLAVILLIRKKTRKCGIFMLIAMTVGLLIGNGIMKNVVSRQRPCWIDDTIGLLVKNPKDFSFPSGHTLASFEAAIMILMFNKKWGTLATTLAVFIGISRLYLFVHFPTDVLGGAVIGTIIAILVYYIGNKLSRKDDLDINFDFDLDFESEIREELNV